MASARCLECGAISQISLGLYMAGEQTCPKCGKAMSASAVDKKAAEIGKAGMPRPSQKGVPKGAYSRRQPAAAKTVKPKAERKTTKKK